MLTDYARRRTGRAPEKAAPIDPWLSSKLYTGKGEDYFALEQPTQAAIFRGKENWLNRFASQGGASPRTIKEEVQALFARWLRMQNFCILMGAGASYYVTKTLNAGLLDRACKLLKGRRSEETLAELFKLTTDATLPAKNIEQFLSQLLGLSTLFDSDALPLNKISPSNYVSKARKRN